MILVFYSVHPSKTPQPPSYLIRELHAGFLSSSGSLANHDASGFLEGGIDYAQLIEIPTTLYASQLWVKGYVDLSMF